MFHLKNGGYIFVNVPAMQSLHSKFDEVLGHVRRYDSRLLSRHLADAGLNVLSVRYWALTMIPVSLPARPAGQLRHQCGQDIEARVRTSQPPGGNCAVRAPFTGDLGVAFARDRNLPARCSAKSRLTPRQSSEPSANACPSPKGRFGTSWPKRLSKMPATSLSSCCVPDGARKRLAAVKQRPSKQHAADGQNASGAHGRLRELARTPGCR